MPEKDDVLAPNDAPTEADPEAAVASSEADTVDDPDPIEEEKPEPKPTPKPIHDLAQNVSMLVEGEALRIEDSQVDVFDAEPKNRYWCGVTPACPFEVVTAVVDFPKHQGPLQMSPQGNPIGGRPFGRHHALTEAQVGHARQRLAAKGIRRNPGRTKAMIKTRMGIRFRPMEGDEPVGRYAYMVRLGAGMPDRGKTPETLIRPTIVKV